MNKRIIAALFALSSLIALPASAIDEPKTDEQKTFYAVGLTMATQLSVFNLSSDEFEFIKKGLLDGISEKTPLVDLESYRKKIQDLAIARRDAQGQKMAAAAKEYLNKAAKEQGAVVTKTGLVYLPQKEGNGASPTATDKVKVNYRGTFIDGKEFDSSYKRNQAGEFALNGVIRCWTEGLQMMKPGGKAKLVCPSDIAYGKAGAGIIPANATLVFEVELLEIKK